MKRNSILSLIVFLVPFIIGILYVFIRYYLRSYYNNSVYEDTVIAFLIGFGIFWWNVIEPYLDKIFYLSGKN